MMDNSDYDGLPSTENPSPDEMLRGLRRIAKEMEERGPVWQAIVVTRSAWGALKELFDSDLRGSTPIAQSGPPDILLGLPVHVAEDSRDALLLWQELTMKGIRARMVL